MAYRIMQFRFYGRDHVDNYPRGIAPENLQNGSIFRGYTPIVQLGVQFNKEQSIKFYINNSPVPILAHPYGLFELDLTDKTYIHSLKFDLFDKAGKLMVSEGSPLIIDIVYEE